MESVGGEGMKEGWANPPRRSQTLKGGVGNAGLRDGLLWRARNGLSLCRQHGGRRVGRKWAEEIRGPRSKRGQQGARTQVEGLATFSL